MKWHDVQNLFLNNLGMGREGGEYRGARKNKFGYELITIETGDGNMR